MILFIVAGEYFRIYKSPSQSKDLYYNQVICLLNREEEEEEKKKTHRGDLLHIRCCDVASQKVITLTVVRFAPEVLHFSTIVPHWSCFHTTVFPPHSFRGDGPQQHHNYLPLLRAKKTKTKQNTHQAKQC